MPIARMYNRMFFKRWSRDMAYVLGFFFADGNMLRTKRGTHFVSFYSNDKVIISAIRTALDSTHTLGVQKRYTAHATNYRLQIGSRELYYALCTHGATPHKSRTLTFPYVPAKYMRDFVRGYFDGDGNVYFKKHIRSGTTTKRWVFSSRFTCGSRTFLEELHAVLHTKGVCGGYVVTKYKNTGYELVLSHKDSVALYRFIYHNTVPKEMYLPRKYKRFTRAVITLYGANAAVAQR